MFRKDVFLAQLSRHEIQRSLITAMFALSARFTKQRELLALVDNQAWRAGDLFAQRANMEVVASFNVHGPICLNDVKTAYLLCVFDNTRYPGRKAWYGVGRVVRLAYSLGLDQVDQAADDGSDSQLSNTEKEERRYLWWHIWKLDCFSNVAYATPRTIDDDSACTALVTTSREDFTAGRIECSDQIFLDNDYSNAWLLAKKLASSTPGNWSNMYIVANSIIHEAAAIRRRLRLRTGNAALQIRQDSVENTLTAFRLALPPGFTSTVPMQCEMNQPSSHRLRLEVLIQLQM